jgi:hypothetical protein
LNHTVQIIATATKSFIFWKNDFKKKEEILYFSLKNKNIILKNKLKKEMHG